MWQNLLGHYAVLTKGSEEFAPHYLAEIRHDMRQTTDAVVQTRCAFVATDAREDAQRGVGSHLQALVSGYGH